MMKLASGLFLTATAMIGFATPAMSENSVEQGYKPGSLGVSAIVSGEYAAAITQLSAMDGVTKNDPARLINLGNAYAGLGRYREAARAYSKAIKSADVNLVLANGSEASSRSIARQALQRLPSSIAMR